VGSPFGKLRVNLLLITIILEIAEGLLNRDEKFMMSVVEPSPSGLTTLSEVIIRSADSPILTEAVAEFELII
jgi:hypothetical protein